MKTKNFLRIIICVVALSAVGCGPSRPSINYGEEMVRPTKSFPTDPIPPELLTHCRSQTLSEGCEAITELDGRIFELVKLHFNQMEAFEKLVRPVGPLLAHPESPPAATVAADQPKTKNWSDPDASYPSKMTVRVEFKDGFDRLDSTLDIGAELPKRIAALKKASKSMNKEWAKAIARAKVPVPKDILKARASTTLTLRHNGRKISAKNVPVHLLEKYIKREQPSWQGIASHVIDSETITNRALTNFAVPMEAAMTVSSPKDGKGDFVIQVASSKRERHEFAAKLLGRYFCDELRAEMRFVHEGSLPPKKVVFRKVAKGAAR